MKLIERILISCYRDNLTKVMVWQKMNKKEQNVEKFSEKSLIGKYFILAREQEIGFLNMNWKVKGILRARS